jgi:hypothetical protein
MEWRSRSKWIDLCGAPAGLFIGAQILGVILSVTWACGPPIEVKIGSSLRRRMKPVGNGEGRRRSG